MCVAVSIAVCVAVCPAVCPAVCVAVCVAVVFESKELPIRLLDYFLWTNEGVINQ